MSACLEDTLLIRLVAGELPPETRSEVAAHLAACTACRERYDRLAATWEVLGVWSVHAPQRDLSAAILRAATRRNLLPWLRIAASVALAAGLGAGVASIAPPRYAQVPPPQPISDQELVGRTGLEFLGGESSGLEDLFAGESEDRAGGEEGRS